MSDRYQLVALQDEQLLAALSVLVRRENDALSDLLAHLAELDERRLYLELGFSSLFAYCTEVLGFCKSSAGRRIAAARVCRNYPEAFARVARGELQLSVLSALAQHLTPKNAAELFEACGNKSYEQVELLLAARFPKPDVRDSIRRLPTGTGTGTPDIGSDSNARPGTASADAGDLGEVPSGCVPPVSEAKPPTAARERVEPLSADRFGVHFTADAEFRELLEEVRELASHALPGGELQPLLKQALTAYRRELQKRRFGIGAKARRAGAAPRAVSPRTGANRGAVSDPVLQEAEKKRTRYITAAVARAVYLRDGGCCTFRSEDGRRCGARRFLELDHIEPWAEGGESTACNLRLRCRAHNQHAARLHFGGDRIREAVAETRSERRGAIRAP
ncbi:MAG TPA: HNH endonuclease signature motif containing protein [Polyangiaceae bacterium]